VLQVPSAPQRKGAHAIGEPPAFGVDESPSLEQVALSTHLLDLQM
jgi:hypothetical protein